MACGSPQASLDDTPSPRPTCRLQVWPYRILSVDVLMSDTRLYDVVGSASTELWKRHGQELASVESVLQDVAHFDYI